MGSEEARDTAGRGWGGVAAIPYAPALDLGEVTLVDVGAVRFLSVCEQSGIELLHCAPYIRHWMGSERAGQGDGRGGRGEAERRE